MQQLRPLIFACIIAGVSTTGAPGAWAQTHVGAPVMQDPISIRASSMGLTGAADNSDPGNIWFNPANAAGKHGVYLDHGRWETNAFPYGIDNLPITRWSAGGTFGVGENLDLGVSATYGQLDYGTLAATDPIGNSLGELDTWERYAALTAAVMTRLDDRVELRMGVAGTYYRASYPASSFTQEASATKPDGITCDLGIAAALPIAYEGWTITPAAGFAYVNFGGNIDVTLDGETNSDPFPARLHYGSSVRVDGPDTGILSARVPLLSFVFNVDAIDYLHGESWSWGMGGELSVMQILFLRSGMMDSQRPNQVLASAYDRPAWSVGLGVPAGPARVRFDYGRVYDFDEPRYEFFAGWEF